MSMPAPIRAYVRVIDAINYRIGRMAMYFIFVMMAVLLWSSFSKIFLNPSLWTVETAQFIMVAYYILGGPYSLQQKDDSHVRMDLFYGGWSPRTKAIMDAIMIFFLIAYLCILFYGGLGSTAYSLGYWGTNPFEFFGEIVGAFVTGGPAGVDEVVGTMERAPSAWRPFMWPIKLLMTAGILLMLLQTIAEFFKDLARIGGNEL